VGKALQKQATKGLPRLVLDRKVVWEYVRNTTWVLGFALDIGGAVLMAFAIANAPISIIQPVAGSGLAILALYSHFVLNERLLQQDWLAIGLCIIGTVGVGLTADEVDETAVIPDVVQVVVCCFTVGLVVYLCGVWLKRSERQRAVPSSGKRSESMRLDELIAGFQAGSCFGLSASGSRFAFSLVQHGWPFILAPLGIACSIVLSGSGFFLQTRAFKEGRAVVVSTASAVSSIFVGVFIGIVALGERLPEATHLRTGRVASWLVLLSGIGLLTGGAAQSINISASVTAGLRRKDSKSALGLNSPSGLKGETANSVALHVV